MPLQKRIAAVHDISGIGKCSLTAALPVLSAAGCEAAVIPTAVLSTHTGGFNEYTYRDLTDDMLGIAQHWKKCGFKFDSFYSGFLGSTAQIDIVLQIIKTICNDDTLILIDPAMADNGRLYSTFAPDFPEYMKRLCKRADIITPNITEICLMTENVYKSGPYDKAYIEKLLFDGRDLCGGKIVLTGVYFDDDNLGCAIFDAKSGKAEYIMTEKCSGFYPGTGDMFASALLAAIMNDMPLEKSAKIAVDFVRECILQTQKEGDPIAYGVYFERALPFLMKQLGIIK